MQGLVLIVRLDRSAVGLEHGEGVDRYVMALFHFRGINALLKKYGVRVGRID